MDEPTLTTERRRGWSRFSLRALFVLLTLAAGLAGGLGMSVREAERQEALLREIEQLGGYPFRVQEYGSYLFHNGPNDRPLRSRLTELILGKHYYSYAPIINIGPAVTEQNLREMAPLIEQVRIKEGCNNGETYLALTFYGRASVSRDLISYLERRLPRCRIMVDGGGR